MVGIKDFGMPSCCQNCDLWRYDCNDEPKCNITLEKVFDFNERNSDCPLVEISESNAVSREEAKIALVQYLRGKKSICECIDDCPSVQPKREKGEWIKTQLGTVCNKCYRFPLLNKDENEILSNYCPYCGADMRGEK